MLFSTSLCRSSSWLRRKGCTAERALLEWWAAKPALLTISDSHDVDCKEQSYTAPDRLLHVHAIQCNAITTRQGQLFFSVCVRLAPFAAHSAHVSPLPVSEQLAILLLLQLDQLCLALCANLPFARACPARRR